jgi:hypothetical protein
VFRGTQPPRDCHGEQRAAGSDDPARAPEPNMGDDLNATLVIEKLEQLQRDVLETRMDVLELMRSRWPETITDLEGEDDE